MSDWRLTPENSALIVIDVQEKLMPLIARRVELIANLQKLLTVAWILQLPTVLTAQYVKGIGPVIPEITNAAPGVKIIEKTSFSCCGTEEFVQTVKDLRRQRLIICGIEAHVCIQQTVIDLMKDYFIYLPVDAISARKELDATVAIERMRDCGAVVTTMESVVFELLRRSGTEQFKACLPLFK